MSVPSIGVATTREARRQLPPLALIDQLSMTRILPMVCGSLIVNNKIIEILKLLEECGLSRPPCRNFACYLHLVAATGLPAVPIMLHWTFKGDLLQWRRQSGLSSQGVPRG